jgi:hypothetical protein
LLNHTPSRTPTIDVADDRCGNGHADNRQQNGLGSEVLRGSGQRHEEIHDHGRPLIQMLSRAEHPGHRGNHDHAAADAQQAAQHPRDQANQQFDEHSHGAATASSKHENRIVAVWPGKR